MEALWKQFVQEQTYLKNVSPRTVEWYGCIWKAFSPHIGQDRVPGEGLRESLKEAVATLRRNGLQPISLNSYLSGLNSFLRWAYSEGHLPELVVVPKIKCETKLISTFTPEQVRRLLDCRPKSESSRRVHTLACLLLDSGMRISEASGLLKEEFDFDNLLVRVRGKGGKHRLVPVSLELRKVLYRQFQRQPFQLVFATRNGTRPTRRNLTRDFYNICRKVGVPKRGFHTLRHTFAIHYLRHGGSVFHLQKILGHSTLEMTRRYCNLMTEDLQAVHNGLTLLRR